MKKRNYTIIILSGLLLLELLYYNIVYDVLLVLLLFLTGLSMGRFIPVRLKFVDKCFVRLSLGLGIVGFLLWLSTFYNFNYKSLYLTSSLLLITINYKYLATVFSRLKKISTRINQRNQLFFPIILIFLMLYIMVAAYPIFQNDALTKHVAIPTKMLNSSHWDYNSVECMYFNESSILPHVYYLYLLALGGGKAMVLFNTMMSFFILFTIVRMAMAIKRSNFVANATLLIYLTMPLVYIKSTILYVDIPPQFFIFPTLLILCYLNSRIIIRHIFVISSLLGLGFFAKQNAIFFIIPVGVIIGFILVVSLLKKKITLLTFLFKGTGFLIFLTLPFLPAMLISFYKSGVPLHLIKKIILHYGILLYFFFAMASTFFFKKIPDLHLKKIRISLGITCISWLLYFIPTMFITLLKTSYPWKKGFMGIRYSPLGLDPGSLLSMVFHSSRNSSFPDGLLGIFLLILFITPLILLYNYLSKYKETRIFAFIFFLTLFSYYISILFRFNLRWLIGSFILAVPVCAYTLGSMFDFIKNKRLKGFFLNILLAAVILPGLAFIFYPKDVYTYWGFKKEMLVPNERLTLNANESILSTINRKGIRVLSNNDFYRGTFLGEFYTLTFINKFILDKIKNGEISPQEVLQPFNYYLFDKRLPETPYLPKRTFSLTKPSIYNSLKLVEENQTHLLYQVVKSRQEYHTVLSQSFNPPLSVTVKQNKTIKISPQYAIYKIEIEVERKDDANYWGRWQINWQDANGKFISTSLIPFRLVAKREIYSSPPLKNPGTASLGILYLTSHNEKPIFIHSVKLLAQEKEKDDFLDKKLKEFNRRWPHLAW